MSNPFNLESYNLSEESIERECIVLVSNLLFLKRCLRTVYELRKYGKYRGEVVLVTSPDLKGVFERLQKCPLNIEIVVFPTIDRTAQLSALQGKTGLSGTEISKGFQYHKFHVFQSYFKRWKRILYVDAGMRIFNPIESLLTLKPKNRLFAHSDLFPLKQGSLLSQFNLEGFPETIPGLQNIANQNEDYFQTGLMYFDTDIIKEYTFEFLIELLRKFPNSKTNDQGIINLWALTTHIWAKLPTSKLEKYFLYDYWERGNKKSSDYIALKYPQRESFMKKVIKRIRFELFWILRVNYKLKIESILE